MCVSSVCVCVYTYSYMYLFIYLLWDSFSQCQNVDIKYTTIKLLGYHSTKTNDDMVHTKNAHHKDIQCILRSYLIVDSLWQSERLGENILHIKLFRFQFTQTFLNQIRSWRFFFCLLHNRTHPLFVTHILQPSVSKSGMRNAWFGWHCVQGSNFA